jgi:peptidoglycan hydrolase-like protein with peptidoglycan-binding domain
MHAVLVAISIGSAVAGSVWANDDVRAVQEKLRDDGFYSGEIDGAYSSDLSAALTRYQIRNGLPITGQLDADTSKALGAKAAVVNSATGTEQSSSETWRRLRKGGQKPSANARTTSSPGADETGSSTEMPLRSAAAVKPRTSSETTEPASAPPATTRSSSGTTEPLSAAPAAASNTSSSAGDISTERLRDYVAAYILAGLDKNVGAESEFFADRVEYYDSGLMSRESIREDLKRYDERWPERHFWLAGTITVEPQNDNRVKVTFPLGFKLRNGNKIVNGKVDKTLVLEPAGDDLEIVAVNERKER